MAIDWTYRFLDIRLFYWAYLLMVVVLLGAVLVYWNREHIIRIYYTLRFPEQLIKVNIVYPGNYIRHYWRLIPKDYSFTFGDETYLYDDDSILKSNDWFASKDDKGRLILRIEGEEYLLDDLLKIKNRWDKWPEIYFIYGYPFPVDWQKMIKPTTDKVETDGKITAVEIQFNAADFKKFKYTKIVTDILASLDNPGLLIAVVVLLVILLILVGVGLLNDAGVIQLAKTTAGNLTGVA